MSGFVKGESARCHTPTAFLQCGLGPMQGQAHHFVRYAPEQIEYGIKRYTNETRRLYGVIEKHLSEGREWLAAGQYTIADMANFSWVYMHDWAGTPCSACCILKAWLLFLGLNDMPGLSSFSDTDSM